MKPPYDKQYTIIMLIRVLNLLIEESTFSLLVENTLVIHSLSVQGKTYNCRFSHFYHAYAAFNTFYAPHRMKLFLELLDLNLKTHG